MSRAERWLRVGLVAHVATAVYFQLIAWLPLGRWNFQPCCTPIAIDIASGRVNAGELTMAIGLALPALLFVLGYRARTRRGGLIAMVVATAALAVWLGLQLATHWPPYLFGADARWQAIHARAFAESTQWLPTVGTHLPPDANHLTLQILLLIAVATSVIGLVLAMRRR